MAMVNETTEINAEHHCAIIMCMTYQLHSLLNYCHFSQYGTRFSKAITTVLACKQPLTCLMSTKETSKECRTKYNVIASVVTDVHIHTQTTGQSSCKCTKGLINPTNTKSTVVSLL